jgi:hypothetical protein
VLNSPKATVSPSNLEEQHHITGWWCNNHLEKYEFVNGKDYPIYYGKKTCSKPPTSINIET